MGFAAIATPHHLATAAGMRALEGGGSAVDGALAAAAVLTVVYPHNCALGGDLIALLREPDGEAVVVNASGPAPAGVDVEALRAAGDTMPIVGVDAATVPGLVAGWGALHERAGRRPWAAALVEAEALARDGVAVAPGLAAAIAEVPRPIADPGLRALLDGGDVLRQPALAGTLAELAAAGPRALYEGRLAARFAAGLAALGSRITAADLAAFAPSVEAPLRVALDTYNLLTAGPNSSGILLAQALLALQAAGLDDPLGADAGTLASIFAAGNDQRERTLGDPRFTAQDLPAWLAPEAVARAVDHRPDALPAVARPTGDTIAIVATDADGRAVSLIQSLFHSFGAQVLEPSTGILLHNRGSAFSLRPDHPNVIAPGKRPMHTLMPVVVERDGALLGVLGTMGGKVQAQIHAQLLVHLLGGAGAQEAVAAPRFAVGATAMGEPASTVRVERDCDPAAVAALAAAGLAATLVAPYSEWLGHAHAIWCDPPSAGSDPRADGAAALA
ncbi:MAG TPA: gamma-glutamyltransferase [Baekduia sp.]